MNRLYYTLLDRNIYVEPSRSGLRYLINMCRMKEAVAVTVTKHAKL